MNTGACFGRMTKIHTIKLMPAASESGVQQFDIIICFMTNHTAWWQQQNPYLVPFLEYESRLVLPNVQSPRWVINIAAACTSYKYVVWQSYIVTIKMAGIEGVFAKAEREQAKIEETLVEKKMRQQVLDLETVTLQCGIAKQEAIGCGGYFGIIIHWHIYMHVSLTSVQ